MGLTAGDTPIALEDVPLHWDKYGELWIQLIRQLAEQDIGQTLKSYQTFFDMERRRANDLTVLLARIKSDDFSEDDRDAFLRLDSLVFEYTNLVGECCMITNDPDFTSQSGEVIQQLRDKLSTAAEDAAKAKSRQEIIDAVSVLYQLDSEYTTPGSAAHKLADLSDKIESDIVPQAALINTYIDHLDLPTDIRLGEKP